MDKLALKLDIKKAGVLSKDNTPAFFTAVTFSATAYF